MADALPPQMLSEAPFPAPPPFWRSFTKANEEELRNIEEAQSEEKPTTKLPIHLAYLRPPPPPTSTAESYLTFNQYQSLDPTHPALPGPEELLFDPYSPSLNHASLLSKLTKSLMLNFLELTSVLSNDPTQFQDKMADLRRLFLNVHVVINIYRPHQARESLKEMLEQILEDGEREIRECDEVKERVEEFLSGIADLSQNDLGLGKDSNEIMAIADDELMEKQKKQWAKIQDIG
jgi:mediator of RNA polymerase II transcription subunit 7